MSFRLIPRVGPASWHIGARAARIILVGASIGAQTAETLGAQTVGPGVRDAGAAGFAVSAALIDDGVLIGRSGAEIRMATYPQEGAVYVFRRSDSGWVTESMFGPEDGTQRDAFGTAMAARDGGVLVGAPGANDMRGLAYVFMDQGDGWTEVLRLDPGAEPNAGAGSAVALGSDFGLVGAPGGRDDLPLFGQAAAPQPGAVYVFRQIDGEVRVAQTLVSPDPEGSDRFGSALLALDDAVFVGAPGYNGGAGAVFRFVSSPDGFVHDGTLTLNDARAGDRLGSALAGSEGSVLAGAPGRDRRGAVYVFEPESEHPAVALEPGGDVTPGSGFGASISSWDAAILVGAPGANAGTGAAYVFDSSTREHTHTFSGEDFGPGATFGSAVAISDVFALVAAGQADLRLGAAAMFELDGTTWRASGSIRDPYRPDLTAVLGEEVTCEDGEAAGYSCSDVDMVSFVPLTDLGAGPTSIANDIWGWTDEATGREYVLLGKSNGTSFVDITNPESPVYLGELPLHEGANENLWRDIKTYRDHAYIVADGAGAHGMQVFDLTRLRDVTNPPVTFEETAHYDRVFSSHNVVINEDTGFAYSVGGGGGAEPCGGGLHMIDIRDPASPTFAGCFMDSALGGVFGAGYTHDAQCVVYSGPDNAFTGREICFQATIAELGISDITDKDAPVLIARSEYPGIVGAHQGWLSEDQRYFYMGDELDEEGGTVERTRTLVWDVSELEDPILVNEYFAETTAIDHNQYVRGDFLYQSNLLSGLRVLDISDPGNPREVAFFDTSPGVDGTAFGGSWSNYPYFPSGVIAVSSWNEGLFILRKRETRLVP